MAKISSNIDEIIKFLQTKKEEGFKTVEVITDARAYGWKNIDGEETITFITSKSEPTVLGIDARIKAGK